MKKNINNSKKFVYLNFWQLAFIIFGSIGTTGILFGHEIGKKYGVDNCIGSFIVANLINWLIGMIVITMSSKKRVNAITNIKNYMGFKISLIASFCLLFAFISWYMLQLGSGNSFIDTILNTNNNILNLRIGAVLGILATLISIGGLKNIKYLSIISGIVLLFITVYFFFTADDILITNFFGFSFKPFGMALFFLLPAMLNLPTFFRYSYSKADSFLALFIIFVVLTFILISSLWISNDIFFMSLLNKYPKYLFFLKNFIIAITALLTISNLLVNIFFASACWESIILRNIGSKEYAIIGLLGTAAFTFFQISPTIQFFMDLANYFIAILVIVLIIIYIANMIKSSSFIRLLGGSSWLIGCFTAVVLEYRHPDQKIYTLMISIGISCLFFLCSFFLEESIWAIKNKIKKHK